eukprot:1161872-Pelagomonas_calceolata.AAC.3
MQARGWKRNERGGGLQCELNAGKRVEEARGWRRQEGGGGMYEVVGMVGGRARGYKEHDAGKKVLKRYEHGAHGGEHVGGHGMCLQGA